MPGAYIPPHKRHATPSSGAAPAPSTSTTRSSTIATATATVTAATPTSSIRTRAPMPFQRTAAAAAAATTRRAATYTFFGDSFVRLFGLVENPSIRVRAFKGASAKGLGRTENTNRAQIARECSMTRATDRCIFSFGSVDVHLSYYHKTFVLGEDIDLEEIAKRYVEFVASISTPAKKTIVGVYPSPLDDENVALSLVNYGSLSEDKVDAVAASDDVKLAIRQGRVKTFNRALATHCLEHDIEYDDLLNEMFDDNGLRIREKFRDVSDHNIHIVWETTILEWIEKWPWFKELVPASFREKTEQTLREYLKTKPWAERTHVSQGGVTET